MREKLKKFKSLDKSVLRVFVIFLTGFFLLSTLLTSFVLLPKIHQAFEQQHVTVTNVAAKIEVELLRRFIESYSRVLSDLGDFPVIVNAALLASANNPDFIDLVDNFSISGQKSPLVLQDISGEFIYQTNKQLRGSYNANEPWVKALLAGDLLYHFELLEQRGNQFSFVISIPVKYGLSIEGILSTEISVDSNTIFSPNLSQEGVAIRLTQGLVSVQTSNDHILLPREFSIELAEHDLTLTYISDHSPVIAAEDRLKETVLYTLFVGLVISFLIFVVFAYRILADNGDVKVVHENKRRVYAIPAFIGLLGIMTAIAAYMAFKNHQEQAIKQTILSDTSEQIRVVKEEVASNLYDLQSLKAFYDASETIGRKEFSTFTRALLENNADIKALEWIPKIPHNKREEYELKARTEGLPDFNITQRERQGVMVPASVRDVYFPVYYLEPLEGNQASVGFDLSSNAKRLRALHLARDSGKWMVTSPVKLVQEGVEEQAGVLVFYPIYEGVNFYNTSTARAKHLKGFVVMVLGIGDMVNRALRGKNNKVNLQIEDITATPENIFGSKQSSANQETFSTSVLDIAGRQWKFTATSNLDAYVDQKTFLPLFVLIGGLIFTAFIVYALSYLIRRRQIIEGIVEQRTEELEDVKSFQDLIMSNIPDLLFVKDEDFRIVQANPAFLEVYPEDKRDAVIGYTTLEEYDPEDAEEFLKHDTQALERGYSEVEESINFPDGKSRILFTKKVRFEDKRGNKFVLGLGRDITDIKLAEAALIQSEERYELAVRGSAVGLWDWNIKENKLFWADRFKQIIGITDKSFIPKFEDFSERLHPEDKEKTLDALMSHVENRTPYDVDYRLKHTDGTYVWIHSRGQALWDDEGNATRVAGSVDDISDKKKAEIELLRTNIELERFAYVASHDLQEPLRMVSSFTALLEKHYADKLDDQAKEYITYASDGARRMQGLVEDLLEYARSGQDAEHYESVDANDVLNFIQENLKEAIDSSNARITHDALPVIFTNPIRFMRVLQNLVGNALKYRTVGVRSEVHISAAREGDEWLFSVKDNGIGMRQEYGEKIFEPFKRLHGKTEYSGTGMGLAICRKIIEGFGGKIYVESELEKGSTFYFTIPVGKENKI
ncbi:MAG: CHASE domain-containing protein [Gammaproteobacteria bacterium]